MTIHPDAIKEFLERTRNNHDWMKKLSGKVLDRELHALGFEVAKISEPLRHHQKVCALLGIAYPSFAYWLDMGLGKSRLALELIRYFKQQGEITGALILAKSESAVIAWEDEIKRWKIDMPYVLLLKSMSTAEKWNALADFKEGLIVATYGAIRFMLCTTELALDREKQVRRTATGRQKRKLKANPTLIKRLGKLIQILVPDEATVLATLDSRISRLFYQLRKYAPYCWELAGVPHGRDPSMLWRQLHLVDKGETLGETMGLFRAAFFTEKKNYFGGYDYKFNKSMAPVLHEILKHRSISYDEKECLDLPEVVSSIEEVRLPLEAKAYYERFVKEIKRSRANYEERRNSFIRMRQVSSGFVGFRDDDTGEKAELEFAVNPKLERLLDLIQEIPKGRKFVIFHEFRFSGQLIENALNEAGIKHVRIWQGTKDHRGVQSAFDHDDSVRGILASHRLAAYSLNLQVANYIFVFEAPISPIDDRQMRKRVARQGQTRTVFSYDLICKGTVDGRILNFHKEGKSLFDSIIRNPDAIDKE